jgi:hypothetical protein
MQSNQYGPGLAAFDPTHLAEADPYSPALKREAAEANGEIGGPGAVPGH